MRTPLLLMLVAVFAAFPSGGTVSAKTNKSNPGVQITTQKAAVAPARENLRGGRYQMRLNESRKLLK
jgi:hypothetical protein